MFETLFKMIPWGSIIMEGVNGLCEIVDNIFGNNPSRNYNNTYYAGPQQYVQPQINNTQNYYSNNITQYNKPNMVYYNEEGKQMIQGVYFID